LENTFIAISEDCGDPVHIIRALSISEWRLSALHQYSDVSKRISRIRQLYDFESQHKRLVSIYTTDIGLEALVNGIRNYLLLGDFAKANESYAFVKEQLMILDHVNSLELCIIPLCSNLLLMEMYDEAVVLFFHYYALQAESDSFSMFVDQLPYIADMLLQLSSLDQSEKDRLKNSVLAGEWVSDLKLFTADMNPISTRRTQAIPILESAGLGIDRVKAHLGLLAAKNELKKEFTTVAEADAMNATAMQYCLAALYFADATFNNKNVSNVINTICCHYVKAHTLVLMYSLCRSLERGASEEEAYALLALDVLIDVFKLAEFTTSNLMAILTGRQADSILTMLQAGNMSSGRLVKLGKVAELSTGAVLSFPSEKAKPLLDFSRSAPMGSLSKDEARKISYFHISTKKTVSFNIVAFASSYL
jgi:hypothetical protein